MLAIRMKRTGRKGHAMYRMIVQDSHRHPMSGKVVSYVGSYDPHAKKVQIDKERVEHFLTNGAQPSNKVAIILQAEGVALPKWVKIDQTGQGKLRNPEKLRKNQPKEAAKPADKPAETPADEQPAAPEATADETTTDDAPAETDAQEEDKAAEDTKESKEAAEAEQKDAEAEPKSDDSA